MSNQDRLAAALAASTHKDQGRRRVGIASDFQVYGESRKTVLNSK